MKIKAFALAATTGTALLLAAGPATAAVTFDPTCPYEPSNGTGACGFVGKGDVQSALGYNNPQVQKRADTLVFTYQQAAARTVSQSATQTATQTGMQPATQSATQAATQTAVQAMSEMLSCTVETGSGRNQKTFYREGSRSGQRSGTRTGIRSGSRSGSRQASRLGTRVGSRTGVLNGSVSDGIAYLSRAHHQIDGFLLTSVGDPDFVSSGDPVWSDSTFGEYSYSDWGSFGEWSFGDYAFGDWSFGDYTFGDTIWGDWSADPGESPSECAGGNPGVTNVVDTIRPGDVTPGAIADGAIIDRDLTMSDVTPGDVTPGAITYGATSYGVVVPSGPGALYVNGMPLG